MTKYHAKKDERILLCALQARSSVQMATSPTVREIVDTLGMHHKRAEYICKKWSERGWYDWGVSVLTGWLEGDGLTAVLKETDG